MKDSTGRSVFEAKKRFGPSVLNELVTCNHVHLLVKDTGRHVIPQSMHSIARHIAQEYNQRKGRAAGSLLERRPMHREVAQLDGAYTLRKESEAYGGDFASENDALRLNNTISWEENVVSTET